ncbi:MAG: hypothetical protein JKY52_09250 [Flavobacteriales bacterium]|nr:hypothetical protein [Flavobacteriales bacterium]
MANPVSAIIDPAALAGTGAASFGFAAAFAQYNSYVTFILAVIISTMTIFYLYNRSINVRLDRERLELDIQIKKDQLKRRATDHDPVED